MDASVRGRYLALLSEAFAEPSLGREEARAPVIPRLPRAGGGLNDPEDSARVLAGFNGLPSPVTRTLRYVQGSRDGRASAYAWDEETGMVYILD